MKLFSETSSGFTAGTADNALCFTSPDVSRYNNFQIQTDNAADVEISQDRGATWVSTAIALEDVHIAAPGTRVLLTAANKVFRFAPGLRFTNFRVRQAGASNVTKMAVLCTRDGE